MYYLLKYFFLLFNHRKGENRRIVVTKTKAFSKKKIPKLKILPNTLEKTAKLLEDFPLTEAELEYVVPLTDQTVVQSINGKQSNCFISNYLVNLIYFCRPEHTC